MYSFDYYQKAKLIAPQYLLGEQVLPYHEIVQWQQRAANFSMAPEPTLWGWGTVHKNSHSVAEMAVATAKKTLLSANVHHQDIDTLIFCSTYFPDRPNEHISLLREVACPLNLEHTEIIGVTLGRCTNLIKGLRLAQARIASGQSKQALVVTSDCIVNEEERMENFALFSDGAASCLVCIDSDPRPGFSIIANAEKQDLGQLSQGLSVELSKAVNQALFHDAQILISDVNRLFHTNVYLPICNLKEMQAGYQASQLYTNNIMRIGHCFAADPLINLIDAQAQGELPHGGLFQLAASVPGARASLLLQMDTEK
ncbi:hypothetical protein KKI93_17620 [Xenorhabdus bovienii]|uniref:3-Oxoacyl-(Acyl-carrier-protein (ACP)) synthase III n=2 Tax=Xenorhabdus TaxID=626 RepID=A0A077PIR6_XENBV|nr:MULTISPECIES: hypothetical protein [Xenorhabdus]MDC9623281.1 hypothetical protein [Xenorhabdus aichiensis]MDE9565825.1 hypothetical protein [Xenorhabdus bovienii]CDH20933.1 3-Oxoacyl-(Acyl-carrier-protein (ACP)) synthase III [Xenorhabdus bovienii str. kraussei Quebec]